MKTPSFDFVGGTRRWAVISLVAFVVSLTALGLRGLNLSIDFVGGTSYSIDDVVMEIDAEALSDAAESAGAVDVRAQVVDGGQGALVRMGALTPGSDTANAVEAALLEVTGAESADFVSVGPTWGQRISQKSIEALVVFLVVIMIYISMRLQFKMAVAAVVALAHDIAITVGVYAILGFSVSPNTVIALLTILGYSLYDSVVVFDRIEENSAFLGEPGRRTYSQMVNLSMNEVLWRSVNTSLTSLLPVGALLFLGAQLLGATTLQDLALALFVGMGLGAYSSLFVAGPFLAWWKEQEPEMIELRERALKDVEDPEQVDAPVPDEAVAARKPITTEYVRGDGKRRKRR